MSMKLIKPQPLTQDQIINRLLELEERVEELENELFQIKCNSQYTVLRNKNKRLEKELEELKYGKS